MIALVPTLRVGTQRLATLRRRGLHATQTRLSLAQACAAMTRPRQGATRATQERRDPVRSHAERGNEVRDPFFKDDVR